MLIRRTASNGVVYYASPLLESLGLPHGFSTRIGGVSLPPFASLNLGSPSSGRQDVPSNIDANLHRFLEAIDCENRRLMTVHQVHGTVVVDADHVAPACQADGLLSMDAAHAVGVRTADCVPILLGNSTGRGVAAVHAGWRGVIDGVVPAAVSSLRARCRGKEFYAAIGPCIGYEAFEVGGEVLDRFRQVFGISAPFVRSRSDGKGHVDLRAAVYQQLLECDLPATHIDMTDRCTFRDEDEFYSHRRDHGLTGRMLAVIAPVGTGS